MVAGGTDEFTLSNSWRKNKREVNMLPYKWLKLKVHKHTQTRTNIVAGKVLYAFFLSYHSHFNNLLGICVFSVMEIICVSQITLI